MRRSLGHRLLCGRRERDLELLRDLARDIGLHLEDVRERCVEWLRPLVRRVLASSSSGSPALARAPGVLVPANFAGQQIAHAELLADLLRRLLVSRYCAELAEPITSIPGHCPRACPGRRPSAHRRSRRRPSRPGCRRGVRRVESGRSPTCSALLRARQAKRNPPPTRKPSPSVSAATGHSPGCAVAPGRLSVSLRSSGGQRGAQSLPRWPTGRPAPATSLSAARHRRRR